MMNSILLYLTIAISINFQRSSVECLDLRVVTTGTGIANRRIVDRIPDETEEYETITSCGGVLTSAPGRIEQLFELDRSSNTECTWKIHAPAGQSVYIRELYVSLTSLPGRSLGDYTDSIDLQVYEGSSASIAKRLYNFKRDRSLEKCISNGRIMTVVLKYAESGLHAKHEVTLKYGFAERSGISDLLN